MTWAVAALAIDTGIPMSVLLTEPDEYLQAMFDVSEYRNEKRKG